jgi:hypothetical protein
MIPASIHSQELAGRGLMLHMAETSPLYQIMIYNKFKCKINKL